MPKPRRQQLQYYDRYPASRQRSSYREPVRYRRHEASFLERLWHFLIVVAIVIVVALLLGFAVTHLQQTLQVVAAIFSAISFFISIFPLLLRIAGVLLGIFVVLFVGYWVVRIWTAISRSLSIASAERAQAAALKAKAKQEKIKSQQSSVQVQREQVRLAKESFDQDQHRRTASQQPQLAAQQHRTRVLTRPIEDAPHAPSSQPQPVSPALAPSVSQLLNAGAIRVGQTDMVYGFEVVNGKLELIRGELPITAIIAGRGRSGKTRRMMLMVFQALLLIHAAGGGKITICDPHYEKDDSLAKVLASFAPWVQFAITETAIVEAAKDHSAELESRLTPAGSLNGEGQQIRLLIIDEFNRLMKRLSKKDKQVLTTAVRESAVQWGGVGGRAWIAGQEFTMDALGDTAIRKDAQVIFCHPLSDEYASDLFPKDTRAQRMVQQISRRECVYKDSDNVVKRIITPTVGDEQIDGMVAYLTRYVPRQVSARRTTRHMQQQAAQPAAQPIQRASVQQQPGHVMPKPQYQPQYQTSFYLARTVDLAPKAPTPQSQAVPPAQPAASATWEYDDTQRQDYGRGSRSLHRNRLTAAPQPQQPSMKQTTSTTDDLSGWKPATGEPDDTVLVPEPPSTPRSQFKPRLTTGKMQAAPPTTEDLVQRAAPPVEPPSPDAVSQLAQLRRRPTKI